MASELLLLAFKYPPYAGVGGYRWSKLTKHLARLGHRIHVLTVDWQGGGPNTLLEDVTSPNIIIHRLPSGYPHNLRYHPYSSKLIRYIRDRFFAWGLSYIYFDDEAQRWGSHVVPYGLKLIKEKGIKTIIATGAPFQANRWAGEIKKAKPELRLIQDFRDPWIDLPSHPAKKKLLFSQSFVQQITAWQKEALERADVIVTITTGLRDVYQKHHPQGNYEVISNGFDGESLGKVIEAAIKKKEEKGLLTLTHIGNLFCGRDRPLRHLLLALRKVLDKVPKLQVKLIGGTGGWLKREFQDLIDKDALQLHPPVSQKEALRHVLQSTMALQVNAKELPYLVSTKIFEYAACKVPTLSINYGGQIETLVRERNLGHSLHCERDSLVDFLLHIEDKAAQEFSYDIDDFDYAVLAKNYSQLIES
mgnify:CR=1 FL=1